MDDIEIIKTAIDRTKTRLEARFAVDPAPIFRSIIQVLDAVKILAEEIDRADGEANPR